MNNIYAIDIETVCAVETCKGFGSYHKCDHALDMHRGRITCIGVWTPNHSQVFRDLTHFKMWFYDQQPQVIGHNFKFDAKFLITNGMDVKDNWIGDSQLLASLYEPKIPDEWLEQYEVDRREKNKGLDPGHRYRKGSKHSLKTLAPYYLGVAPFWETPENLDNDEYVLKDCEYSYRLYEYFIQRTADFDPFDFYKTYLFPAEKFLLDVEMRGISLDLERIEKDELEIDREIKNTEANLREMWAAGMEAWGREQEAELMKAYKEKLDLALSKNPKDITKTMLRYDDLLNNAINKLPDFNIHSPTQMLWLMKNYLKLDVTNEKDEESTGIFVLQKLARTRDDIMLYLRWRELKKLKGSFYASYKELQYKGKLYTNFRITGTRTGRLSSANPNMQQIHSGIKHIFVPKKDHVFISYDLSAIEARLIACESGDAALCHIVERGLSIHDNNAKVFFGLDCDIKEVKEKYPLERQVAKTGGFSLFYGAGAKRIKGIFVANDIHKEDQECQEILNNFKNEYKDSFERHRDITQSMETYKLYNSFGRPIIVERPEDRYMKGYNSVIQSLASDLTLFAAMRAQERFNEMIGYKANVLLLVHDSILVEAHKEDADWAAAILEDELKRYSLHNEEKQVTLKVECEGGVFDHWQ